MSSFYTGLRDRTASRLIRLRGKPATIVRSTSEAPSSSWAPTASAESRATLPVRILETESLSTRRLREAIKTGDKAGLISMEGVTDPIEIDDLITIGSKTYRFIELMPLEPGEVTVLYEFLARA